jgi:8-oxo-dGTP pyrophosphatase MutT (NUDIX family)
MALAPAEQMARWADQLRDLSAAGLVYAANSYDQQRYQRIQSLALEMLAYATAQPLAALEPLRPMLFARMSPLVAGSAAVIDREGRLLLMQRADNRLWSMPAGQMEVGETPAQAVVRETLEETGVTCNAVALVGVYDSRLWERGVARQVYKFTFLCEPLDGQDPQPFDPHETLATGWFAPHDLPGDLYPGHFQRICDAYRVWRGDARAHFD